MNKNERREKKGANDIKKKEKNRKKKLQCKLEKEGKSKNKIYQQDAIRDLESMP